MRVLGGSIGIACSTAILGVTEHKQLIAPGIVTDSQLADLQTAAATFSQAQAHAVTQAYGDAFSEDLRVCAIISGICVLVTLGTFQKNRQPVLERRRDQQIVEQRRLRELKQRAGGMKDTDKEARDVARVTSSV